MKTIRIAIAACALIGLAGCVIEPYHPQRYAYAPPPPPPHYWHGGYDHGRY